MNTFLYLILLSGIETAVLSSQLVEKSDVCGVEVLLSMPGQQKHLEKGMAGVAGGPPPSSGQTAIILSLGAAWLKPLIAAPVFSSRILLSRWGTLGVSSRGPPTFPVHT